MDKYASAGCRLAVSFALSTFQRSLLTLCAYGRPSKPAAAPLCTCTSKRSSDALASLPPFLAPTRQHQAEKRPVLSVLLFNPIRPFPQPQGLGPPQAGPKASQH